MQLLKDNQLYVHLKKSDFQLEHVKFLEPIISKDGLVVDLAKIEAVVNQESPKNVNKNSEFLMIGGLLQEISQGILDYCCAIDKIDEEERTFCVVAGM